MPMWLSHLLGFIAVISVTLLGSAKSAEVESSPLPQRPPAPEGSPLFQAMDAARSGVDFRHRWNPPAKHRDQLTNAFSGGGVALGDYDKDGLPDLFLCGQTRGGQLYQNLGDFRFANRSSILTPQPKAGTWATGATWADVDNDGWLDLYVCGFDCPNRLYLNRARAGKRLLVESARALGVDFRGASVVGTFADYDRDGDLDLFVVTNRLPAPESLRHERFSVGRDANGEPVLPEAFRQYADLIKLPGKQGYKRIDAGQYDHLYRNEGPGKPFTDVTREVGMSGNHYGLSATWWDWNGDGWPDLYVANDFFGPDQLWTNNGAGPDGKVTFTNRTASSLPHTPWFSMGVDIADINNDGLLDILATDMAGSTHYNEKMQMGNMSGPDSDAWFLNHPVPPQYMRNAFYLNTGTDRFMESAHLLGVSKTDWTWSVNFGDLDNDGWEDLVVTTGMSRDWLNSDLRARAPSKDGWDRYYDFWYAQKPLRQTNRAFRNRGGLKMQEVGKAWGLDTNSVSFGSALSDLDGDGDLDAVINHFDGAPSLYRNQEHSGKRMAVRLVGASSNRFGLGTLVTVRPKDSDQVLTRYLTSSRGFMSSPEPVVHFGLGLHETISKLTIRWPSGHTQSFENLATDHRYTIREPSGRPQQSPSTAKEATFFVSSQKLKGIRHRERPFDDFARQPLLPSKHSQLGPGIAFADVDGNGTEEFYLCQGAGTPGRLYFRKKAPAVTPFDQHTECEDITAVFFDADGDGDQDLYVVSGGVEGAPNDRRVFQDRLYLNDGKGDFSHAKTALPPCGASGGPVAVSDYDHDGDLDVFVGGRVIPGRYPETPRSQLLRNDTVAGKSQFRDLANEAKLEKIGMVTAAAWADIDNDSWEDLILATEWGPVRVFLNKEGSLVEATGRSALAEFTGLWSSLAAGDVDGDGDIDLVAGNLGLNTKYKATAEHPELLYFGDLDGTGTPRILEAKFEGDVCLPRRGFSCSTHAMPALRKKLTSFHAFASRSLEAIYSEERIEKARRFEANTLTSGIFFNDGKGVFRFDPLPRLAQAFPVYGIALHDVDGDGHSDIYLIGNSHSPQRETGNMDGGVSLLLRGNGSGRLSPVWPNKSGLVVAGDAKGLALTDLNGDGKQDIVVTLNNGELRAFERR